MGEFGGIEEHREEERSEARPLLSPTTPRKRQGEMTGRERRLRNVNPYDLSEVARATRELRAYKGYQRCKGY